MKEDSKVLSLEQGPCPAWVLLQRTWIGAGTGTWDRYLYGKRKCLRLSTNSREQSKSLALPALPNEVLHVTIGRVSVALLAERWVGRSSFALFGVSSRCPTNLLFSELEFVFKWLSWGQTAETCKVLNQMEQEDRELLHKEVDQWPDWSFWIRKIWIVKNWQ